MKKLFKTFLLFGLVILQTQAQRAKFQFILFWRSDCGNCKVAIEQLVSKCRNLNKDDLNFTIISFDTDSVAYFNALNYLKMEGFNNKYNFAQGYTNNPLAKKYNITKTPTLLCVDAQGIVLAEGNEAFKKLTTFKKE